MRFLLNQNIKLRYKRKGIYFQTHLKDKNNYRKFIRIATLSKINRLPFETITFEKRQELEKELFTLRDELTSGEISKKKYLKLVNKFRDNSIIIDPPFTEKKNQNKWLSNWNEKREKRLLSENLVMLLNYGIEIQLLPLSNSSEKFIVVLIDYGPNYPLSATKKTVINRISILDVYPNLKKLRKLFALSDDLKIQKHPIFIRSHSQSIKLSEDVVSNLLGMINTELQQSYDKLEFNEFTRNQSYNQNYTFSLPHSGNLDQILTELSFTRTVDFILKPGKQLLVRSDHQNFTKFLKHYSQPEKNKTQNSGTHNLILFSLSKFVGFETINITDLRLDLIDFSSHSNLELFFIIFKTMDLLYGNKYFTSYGIFRETIKEIEEFDKNELVKIDTYQKLLVLLSKQLTNKSFIGKSQNISKLYQILRQFSLYEIFDKLKSKLAHRSNLIGLPAKSNLKTSQLSPQEATFLVFLLFFKLIQLSKSTRLSLEDYTIIIDDQRILRIISQSDICKFLNTFVEKVKGIRVIYHTSSPFERISCFEIPILDLAKVVYTQNGIKKSLLSYGESIPVEVIVKGVC